MFPAASPDRPAGDASHPASRRDSVVALALVAIYCILQITLSVMHDPWLDEAQAWLLATSLSRPLDFFILPGEGHPPLWSWLLRALSGFLDFSQARYVTLPIAMLNAWLLLRLLPGRVPLLAMMLFSFCILQFWGYHFRPYSIVMLGLLLALLLDRDGHPVAGTWALALACGFHFFAGFLFAFFLVWQWHRGTPWRALLAPAVLAAVFGTLAVLSGLGNATAGPQEADVLQGTLANLAWLVMLPQWRHPLVAVLTLALLAYGLHRQPLLLAALILLLVLFAVASASVYGRYPWHMAFMTMLCFMAFTLAGTSARTWVLLVLLAPQVVIGISAVQQRLWHPVWQQPDLYSLVSADAGPGFDPARQLVAWPDIVGASTAAIHGIRLRSGNDGSLLGPIDWHEWDPARIDPALFTMARPYWLLCAGCTRLTDRLQNAGLQVTLLGDKVNLDNGPLAAYRID